MIWGKKKYAILTVDTEALPRRAPNEHVNRLIWGIHDKGTAGIREMCAVGDEFNAKHVFFVDMCSAYLYREKVNDVVHWLNAAGQDVQLHAHPEVLPHDFWNLHGLAPYPEGMNQYTDDARALFLIKHFGQMLSSITGKDVLAYRAGSFRWNACFIRALRAANIPLSFNNSMRAYHAGRCVFSEPVNLPYAWSNGVVEIPVTERSVSRSSGENMWVTLTFPESPYFQFRQQRRTLLSRLFGGKSEFAVFLLHSWSLLYWDENGYATYLDNRRLEDYRRLLARLTKDYDVITTRDFLDLLVRGKIVPSHTVNLENAELRLVA